MNIVSLSIQNKTAKTVTIAWASDKKAAKVYYSIDSATPILYNTPNASNGIVQITNLIPDRSYTIQISVENTGGTEAASRSITFTTYPIPTIEHHDPVIVGQSFEIVLTNPAALTVTVELYSAQISGSALTLINKILDRSGIDDIIVEPTDTETDKMYKHFGLSSTATFAFVVRSTEGQKNIVVTATDTGDHNSIKIKKNSEWKRGKVFTKVNGEWLNCSVWQKINGNWKRGY